MVPLLKVEWPGKPFEGVIAIRTIRFEAGAGTVDAASCGGAAGEVPTELRASKGAIIEPQRPFAIRTSQGAANFADGEARARFGEPISMRSS